MPAMEPGLVIVAVTVAAVSKSEDEPPRYDSAGYSARGTYSGCDYVAVVEGRVYYEEFSDTGSGLAQTISKFISRRDVSFVKMPIINKHPLRETITCRLNRVPIIRCLLRNRIRQLPAGANTPV